MIDFIYHDIYYIFIKIQGVDGLTYHCPRSTMDQPSPAHSLEFSQPVHYTQLPGALSKAASHSFPLHTGVPVSKGTGVVSMWRSAT